MDLLVAARRSLLPAQPPPEQHALLLEGSWSQPGRSAHHQALDEVIDGRFVWIDAVAARLAETAADNLDTSTVATKGEADLSLSAAYLGALALRYYLVKLLRPLAYFTDVQKLSPADCVELYAGSGDRDYEELLAQLCRTAGAELHVHRSENSHTTARPQPPNRKWRRLLGKIAGLLDTAPQCSDARLRIVFCGNPRQLGPACGELRRRDCRLWWLFDRFAAKTWLNWRPAGVGQLVCDSSCGTVDRLRVDLPGTVEYRGIDLSGPIERWLRGRAEAYGSRQTRLVEVIDRHFRLVRPHAVVLDEDATPTARAAVAAARRHGAVSLVVQHGLPCCRFGFTPLAADRFLAWDEPSAHQLSAWGMPVGRISNPSSFVVTAFMRSGSAERPTESYVRPDECGHYERQPPRILLLCTTPPRDARPDSVALHLTRRTYASMLRAAFGAAIALKAAELIVKLHPRSPNDPLVRSLVDEFPDVNVRFVRGGPLTRWLRRVDVVLSCGSTAGVEAAAAGLPTVALAPPGASGFPPAESWGLVGTASNAEQVLHLLAAAGEKKQPPAARFRPPAAEWIADEVLRCIATLPRSHAPHGDARARRSASPSIEQSADVSGSDEFAQCRLVASNCPSLPDKSP